MEAVFVHVKAKYIDTYPITAPPPVVEATQTGRQAEGISPEIAGQFGRRDCSGQRQPGEEKARCVEADSALAEQRSRDRSCNTTGQTRRR